jgi:hypothetical protein
VDARNAVEFRQTQLCFAIRSGVQGERFAAELHSFRQRLAVPRVIARCIASDIPDFDIFIGKGSVVGGERDGVGIQEALLNLIESTINPLFGTAGFAQDLNAEGVKADVLVPAMDWVVRSEMSRASDLVIAKIMDPGLIDFNGAERTFKRLPILTEIIRPVIRARPLAANERSVLGQANGFRDGTRLNALQWTWCKAVAFAIDKLPAWRGEDAVIEKQHIPIRQLNEVGFRDHLAAQDRERACLVLLC